MRRVDDVVAHIVLCVATFVATSAVAQALPKVALIIDDVGYRLAEGERAVRLPGAVAVAVLPFGTHSVALARENRLNRPHVLSVLDGTDIAPLGSGGS